MKLFGNKKAPVIGLDIGSSFVRALQLSETGGGFRVEHFGMEPLREGVVVDKSVQDIEAISNAIERAVRNSGTRTKVCAIAVSGPAVFTKTISLPSDLAESDVESQVQIEANQYVPYPLDEVSLDFNVLGPSARNPDLVDILLAASKSENVESRQDALESAGLVARVVDVEAFAIANAFDLIRERDHLSKNEAVGIFDIGRDLTTLLVIRGGRVIYTREHPFGGHQLLEEAMRRYDMTPEQASFFERGEDGPEDFESEVLEPFQLNIVHQVSRALQFFASSNEYSPISTIYLAGGTASLKGLAPMVQQELGLTTRVADPLSGMDIAPSVAVSALKRNTPSLMVALGLALRGFD
ncbi:pilus assembly protein PilM [Marinihelvus fidelis]|uniref:Pilus assembly protein PilM n=1 Tax=Marinihelvus fidelis TaxID=2613842 RepID=A0A5N0T8K5_9GAMM|nr:pilus assembly protein PilM [Marinihelvus fidelis]KAA9131270.1 pilus assembly protein PilM [Marinihelvus fidelis]